MIPTPPRLLHVVSLLIVSQASFLVRSMTRSFAISIYNYVKRKVWIRTILGFCCANLGSELCAIILGSRMQTSDPRICCANLGSPYFAAQSSDPHAIIQYHATKSRPSADIIARITIYLLIVNHRCLQSWSACAIDRASLPQMGELLCMCDRLWLPCHRRSNCFVRAIGCGFVSADGRAASLARLIVGLLPQMVEVWLRDLR